MALSGMNHWQRACAVMGIVVFLVALMAGLLAAAVGGGGSLAVAASSSKPRLRLRVRGPRSCRQP